MKGNILQRLAALRFLPRLFSELWRTHRGYASAMLGLRLIRSVSPVVILWVAKLIIDQVVALAENSRHPSVVERAHGTHYLWFLVGIEVLTVVSTDLLARSSALVEAVLGDLFTNRLSIEVMRHASTLDLAHFEDPEFQDSLERARQGSTGRVALVIQLLGILQSGLTLIALSAAVAMQQPWLLALLAISVIPSFMGEAHYSALSYAFLNRSTPERRQLDYLRLVGASAMTAKEVQLFGLAPWLIKRFRQLAEEHLEETRAIASRRAIAGAALSLASTLAYYGAYAAVLLDAIEGRITIGALTFLATGFRQSRDLFQGLLITVSGVIEQCLYLGDFFSFFDIEPTLQTLLSRRPVPQPICDGFRFEDVGFRYPDAERWAVRRLTFTLARGERLALVGENGAGKTTIAKLLARLYDPTEGRILLDGVDLREYDLAGLRQAVGVVFQDFVRYDMRFDENIGVGDVRAVGDYLDHDLPTTSNVSALELPAEIRRAAEQSMAATMLPRLPTAFRQMLGRRFEGGVDLSGGEWQKIALARAYMRDSQIIILDEPTASLDARAENDVFRRFSELMVGRTAVVISHRFSTVRMADRIIVLSGGEIAELGTHDELLATAGLYAELFGMQASGYR